MYLFHSYRNNHLSNARGVEPKLTPHFEKSDLGLHCLLISYLCERVCSIFSGAGKFCLAQGLRQLNATLNMTSKFKISEVTSFLHHREKHRMAFEKGRYAT